MAVDKKPPPTTPAINAPGIIATNERPDFHPQIPDDSETISNPRTQPSNCLYDGFSLISFTERKANGPGGVERHRPESENGL